MHPDWLRCERSEYAHIQVFAGFPPCHPDVSEPMIANEFCVDHRLRISSTQEIHFPVVELEGHADSMGSEEYDMTLSKR